MEEGGGEGGGLLSSALTRLRSFARRWQLYAPEPSRLDSRSDNPICRCKRSANDPAKRSDILLPSREIFPLASRSDGKLVGTNGLRRGAAGRPRVERRSAPMGVRGPTARREFAASLRRGRGAFSRENLVAEGSRARFLRRATRARRECAESHPKDSRGDLDNYFVCDQYREDCCWIIVRKLVKITWKKSLIAFDQ